MLPTGHIGERNGAFHRVLIVIPGLSLLTYVDLLALAQLRFVFYSSVTNTTNTILRDATAHVVVILPVLRSVCHNR